jgi:hypothetical protein
VSAEESLNGERADLRGTLIRDGAGFLLKADDGARWRLVLHRVPVDQVEKRVRVIGTHAGDDIIEADGVSLA